VSGLAATLLLIAAIATGVLLMAVCSGSDRLAARVATPLIFGALIIAVWEIACRGFGIPRVLLPPPSEIAQALGADRDTLAADFWQTFVRSVIPGWVIGNAAGLGAAILLDRSDFLRRGVLPLGNLVSAMPIVGIAPIMVMWFGFDWPSKAAVIVVMTFFPMLVNALAGLAEAGAMERDLMRSYAAGYWATLLKLRLPAALPFVFNALKLNSTLALIGGIVAEFFGTPIVGMGFRISTEVAKMNLDIVWAEIVMASVLGCASFAVLALIERAATFWHPSFRR
jgi:NitT/TauT family transport system permease protein